MPEGDARDLLEEAGGAILCRPADVECMASSIQAQLELFRAEEPRPVPRSEVVARYEYRALVGKLSEVFDRVATRP